MYLKINSADGVVFEWDVKEVVVPTEWGEVGILPSHQPMVAVVTPWVVKIKVEDETLKQKFDIRDVNDDILLSVSKGILYVDGQNVYILTSVASTTLEQSAQALEQMKQQLEQELQKVKVKGSVEEIEKALISLQKINADLKLYKLKYWKV